MLILRRTKENSPISKNQPGMNSFLFASHDLEVDYDSSQFGKFTWLIEVSKVRICTMTGGWFEAKTSEAAVKCMGSYCTFEPSDVIDYTQI